ncbi:MAG: autotransporter domain-containing protein, partial [Proteobacteria bacterium]|nr:autotransporter domain-containing protein [Pseudomonadota bacterium]
SIGGGGGIGGQGNASRSSKTLSATLELAVGGGGGTGADGGSITIGSANAPFAATVSTSGARAYGLLAQSVGGGGGIGGTGSANSLLTLTVGGQGSVAGNGGNVSVYAGTGSGTDRISTNGAGAHALVAQSVGGGGGIAGDVSSPGLSLARRFSGVNGSGSGGSVSVDFNGAIQTVGAGAFGIFAQSVGGGGGFGGDASGSFASSTSSGGSGRGGAVTVNQQGTILALGSGGIGIFAQSQGPSGSSAINVTVGGTVYGDQRGGAGVLISSGHDNSLTVTSSGFLSGNGGTAIRYQGDQSTSAGSVLNVYNYGTIFDDVILTNTSGNSAGTVYNYSNNTLVSRSLQANVVNAGTIIVGGRNEIGTTVITGNFEQTRAGTLKLDADFAAGRIDRLSVQGDARLDGRIQVAALSLLPRALTFLDVGGTATGTLQGSRMNNLFDFSISRTGNVYTVTPDADFADPTLGLTPAQTRTAQHLQALWNAGGGSFGPLFTALAATDGGGYANLLGSVQSDTRNAPAAENLALAQQRLDRTMSCPVFAGSSATPVQSECVWSQASGGTSNQGAFNDAAAYGDRVFAVALGGQKRIATDWFLGATAAYENSQIQSSNGGFKANGQMFSVGASVKRESGPWLVAAAAAGNFGSFDTSRFASLANLGGVAKGTQDIGGFGGRLRAAYTWAAERFYVRPFVDLDVVYTTAGGYGESGAGLFNQQVAHSANWAVLGTPSVEVGSRFDVGPDYLMRGYARVGLTVSSLHDWSVQSRFAAAPAGADSFAVMLPLDTVYGRVGAGVQLANIANALSVRLEYDGAFSGHTTRNGGAVRVSLGF